MWLIMKLSLRQIVTSLCHPWLCCNSIFTCQSKCLIRGKLGYILKAGLDPGLWTLDFSSQNFTPPPKKKTSISPHKKKLKTTVNVTP